MLTLWYVAVFGRTAAIVAGRVAVEVGTLTACRVWCQYVRNVSAVPKVWTRGGVLVVVVAAVMVAAVERMPFAVVIV